MKGSGAALLLLGCSALSCAPAANWQTDGSPEARPAAGLPQLMSTDELASWQKDRSVSLVDVRTDVSAYLKGHLPGAVYLNPETLRATEDGIPAQLLSGRSYSELFSRLGLRLDQPVVIYSAGESRNIDATFLAWLLAGFGHPRVYVLNGGYFKWQLEQRPIAQQYPRVRPVDFPDSFQPERASLNTVRQAVVDGEAILVDARPPDQYAGHAGSQIRRGHIPGAINHYWQDDLMQEGFGRVWKPTSDLRRAYGGQGITPDRDIIAYCNSASEASHVHFTLRYLLGYPRVRIYVGSWTEWAERAELPIQTGRGAPARKSVSGER
jgi:thiosulfate/3-mercaptopyruvate sulfurtransferase